MNRNAGTKERSQPIECSWRWGENRTWRGYPSITRGVNRTSRGVVADKTLRTSAPNIYACGDVVGTGPAGITWREYQGIVAATNAILPVSQKVDYRNSVYVIFYRASSGLHWIYRSTGACPVRPQAEGVSL